MNSEAYIICEAKGTTQNLKSPSTYLRRTVRSGRQLSWEWCRETTMRFASVPAAAEAFLGIAGPLLRGEVTRLLCVCEVEETLGGFQLSKKHVWGEGELSDWDWLQADPLLEFLEPHLDDLEARGLL